MDRKKIKDNFISYVSGFDMDDPKIRLKADHTMRVAELCERIAGEAGCDQDLVWLCGILHDIGRFEQVRRYGTFIDSDSVDHAALGADFLFKEGLWEKIVPGEESDGPGEEERRMVETAIRNHNRYRVEEGLTDHERICCDLLRDADKIDIFRVVSQTPIGEIYRVTDEELRTSAISEDVKDCFIRQMTVPRGSRHTAADKLVCHVCLYFELVYPVSRQIAMEQGYLKKILDLRSENPETAAWFAFMRKELKL